ncbi:hypothetical protein NDU88_007270 [Pleurodeles waltl]|uniref:Uncharacterized protein n=1 Tax=Pleurodeles waltl TaxID=8319 RepID=A0AAV7RTK4_PLEWA|nr:hypothetical protein NDU88_007270 [Pleurodeles waltl]
MSRVAARRSKGSMSKCADATQDIRLKWMAVVWWWMMLSSTDVEGEDGVFGRRLGDKEIVDGSVNQPTNDYGIGDTDDENNIFLMVEEADDNHFID